MTRQKEEGDEEMFSESEVALKQRVEPLFLKLFYHLNFGFPYCCGIIPI